MGTATTKQDRIGARVPSEVYQNFVPCRPTLGRHGQSVSGAVSIEGSAGGH